MKLEVLVVSDDMKIIVALDANAFQTYPRTYSQYPLHKLN